MNKNAVYVLKQPEHSIATIVFVEGELTEKVHNNLDKLRTISDLIFIFSDTFDITKKIDCKKFSSLYLSNAYIVGQNLTSPFIEILKYCQNIFKNQFAYLITDTMKLDNIDISDNILEKAQNITLSDISNPILTKTRLSVYELMEIYVKPTKKIWYKGNDCRANSTYRSTSKLMYIKNHTITNLLNLLQGEDEYIETFTEQDISYFLVSALDKFNIGVLNNDIETIEFNGQDLSTEGV
jgi:hypothetical protein